MLFENILNGQFFIQKIDDNCDGVLVEHICLKFEVMLVSDEDMTVNYYDFTEKRFYYMPSEIKVQKLEEVDFVKLYLSLAPTDKDYLKKLIDLS